MKYFWLILLFTFLAGCKSLNNSRETSMVNYMFEDLKINQIDSVALMDEPTVDSLCEDQPRVQAMIIRTEDPKIESGSENLTNVKRKIVDETVSTELEDPAKGILAYSVPTIMKVGKSYSVKLRISKEKDKISLIRNRESNSFQKDTNYSVTIESVRVEPLMTAELFGEAKSFEINLLSTELQSIEDRGFTEWEWQVVPIKSGVKFLKLTVRVRVKAEDTVVFKDITVFDKEIKIKSNISYSSSNFISQYWQWIMTTIVIPFVVWFWNRKKRERKS
jgi:hypothetical protein